MRTGILTLSGVTKENRHQVTADINDAVMAAGGWIIGHTLFSNMATTFRFAISFAGIPQLRELISKAGVRLDVESERRLDGMLEPHDRSTDEITASMNVTFIHDEPDLRREVPAFPG